VTTTTTTYHLRAVTDDATAKVHLGATEKANRTWCGVDLLAKDDPRFGGRYKDGTGFTASTDLSLVDCRACQRTAAWKVTTATGAATIGIPAHAAPKPKASEAKPPTRKRPSAATRAAAKAEQEQAPDQAAGNAG